MIRFLVKATFWFGVALVVLPSTRSEPVANGPQVKATDAVSFASAAASDVGQFCDRKPDACVVGSHVAIALGYRAQAGAKMLYDFLSEQLADSQTGSVTDHPKDNAPPATRTSQDTLTPVDLAPEWHPPLPRKDTRRAGRQA